MAKVLVTVDFDYFVPEDPAWDMGHQETPLFLDMIWQSRGALIDKMKCDGNQEGFWDRIGLRGFPKVFVTDSHTYGFHVANRVGADHVVMVDTHHDCWSIRKGETFGCDNWLRTWLRQNRRRTALWHRPLHSQFAMPERCSRLELSGADEVRVEPADVVGIHICRSGCWVPPWLDEDFIKFVNDLEADEVLNPEFGQIWDCMKPRWTEAHYESARETCAKMENFKENHDLLHSRLALAS